jgi:L-lactate utilization protein LutC
MVVRYDQLASTEAVARAVSSLKEHNIEAEVVADAQEASARVQTLIPEGAEVMVGTSTTLEQIGFMAWLASAPGVVDLRVRIRSEDDAAARAELRRRATTADVMVGSVHAISETGEVVILSRTGSQMSPYLAARKVLWVAGTQKIVPTLEDAINRARDYATPLEDARMKSVGAQGTSIGKTLIFHNEVQAGRITLILVPEVLGF